MTKFKDFGSSERSEELEPVEFALFGETFKCHPGIPGKIMLDIAVQASEESGTGSAKIVNDFFKAVLANNEEAKRFDDLCRDPVKMIPVEKLMEIVTWLIEVYSNRPTQRPEDLPTGQ